MQSKEIKNWLLLMLEEKLDTSLQNYNFKRRKNSTSYKRKIKNTIQTIEMEITINPSYAPEAIAHLYPWIVIEIPEVNEYALKLVQDKWLLANTPAITLRQPLETLIPLDFQNRLLFSNKEEAIKIGDNIAESINEFVIKFLDDYTSSQGIVQCFENNDQRPLMSERWIVYVVAAYIDLNKYNKALEVLQKYFSKAGLRNKYSEAFEYVSFLTKK